MDPEVIGSAKDISPAWLTAVLSRAGNDVRVGGVTAEPVGTGQMGSCFRVHLDLKEGTGPEQLIVKLPAGDPSTRQAGRLGYRCETAFYRDVAPRISVRVPHCYFAEVDDPGDTFTLVLEDLAPAEQGDQIAGCSTERAAMAARNIAGLHAATWNDPSIRALRWTIPDLAANADFVAALLKDGTEQFLSRHDVRPETADILQAFAGLSTRWVSGTGAPFSLIHSDYRLDNLLFAPAGAPDPVIAVDWQVVTVGSPLRDIAFLLETGLRTEDRRRGERTIVAAYHARLTELGVDPYDAERCWADYRFALFQGPLITVFGAMVAQPSERGDRMFTTMADRSAAAIVDLDALSLLEEP